MLEVKVELVDIESKDVPFPDGMPRHFYIVCIRTVEDNLLYKRWFQNGTPQILGFFSKLVGKEVSNGDAFKKENLIGRRLTLHLNEYWHPYRGC